MTPKFIHMEISERKLLLRMIDTFVVVIAFVVIKKTTNFQYFSSLQDNFYWTFFLFLYINLFGTIFQLYHLPIASFLGKSYKGVILTSLFTWGFFLLTPIYTPFFPDRRIEIFIIFGGIFLSILIWRVIYILLLASRIYKKNLLLVCKDNEYVKLAKELTKTDSHIQILGYISLDNQTDDELHVNAISHRNLELFVQENMIDSIVVSDMHKISEMTVFNSLIKLSNEEITIRNYFDVYEELSFQLPINLSKNKPYNLFPYSKKGEFKLYVLFVRFLDLLFASIGLLICCMLIPVVYFINKFANKGPLFYKQERVGKNERLFEIVKFRSMVVNAEKNGAQFAQQNDTRITAFGKILRKTRIDEFPQFINVFLGQMSVIGPRPERLIFVEQIAEKVPLYRTRHIIKPGLTGWAQINYPYGVNIEDSIKKLQFDLYYIKHRNVFLDLKILVKTFTTVLYMRGQ